MNLIDIILLGVALGIDCLVVSFSQGLIFTNNRVQNSLSLAVVMGLFQGFMPVIGYVGTNGLYKILLPYSKWVVFGIFFILGLKFLLEIFSTQKEYIKCLDLKCLIGFGVATSIDALVSGANIKLTHTNLILSCLVIGMISFFMSIVGFYSGSKLKTIPSKYLEFLGGVILILLGIKALIV